MQQLGDLHHQTRPENRFRFAALQSDSGTKKLVTMHGIDTSKPTPLF